MALNPRYSALSELYIVNEKKVEEYQESAIIGILPAVYRQRNNEFGARNCGAPNEMFERQKMELKIVLMRLFLGMVQ